MKGVGACNQASSALREIFLALSKHSLHYFQEGCLSEAFVIKPMHEPNEFLMHVGISKAHSCKLNLTVFSPACAHIKALGKSMPGSLRIWGECPNARGLLGMLSKSLAGSRLAGVVEKSPPTRSTALA